MGSSDVPESAPLTGLAASTEYAVCFVAENGNGPAYAPAVKFTTAPAVSEVLPPTVDSESSSGVTPFDAALEAHITPENQAMSWHFEYATTEAKLGTAEATSVGAGTLPGNLEEQTVGPVDIGGGLTPGTTYFYRVTALNASGPTDGAAQSFTTLAKEKPLVDAESATEVTQSDARLHAQINPDYLATKYQFKLGTTTGYSLGTVLPAEGELAAVFGDSEISVDLASEGVAAVSQLKANTEYHYEAVAVNEAGATEGLLATPGDQTFLTLPNPPSASTGAPSAVTPTSAVIAGSVNPGATGHNAQDDTTYWFQYGMTTSYAQQIPVPAGDAGEGESPVPEKAQLTGLEPDTTYHYRIAASNNNNTIPQVVYGEDHELKTTATPPTLSPTSVSSVTQTSATVNASVNAEGLPARWELQLGSTPGALGLQTSGHTTSSTAANPENLTLDVEQLTPGTVYYYKITLANPDGTAETPESTFTTLPAPPTPNTLAQTPTPLLPPLNIKFPPEEKTKTTVKKLTNTEKLHNALKACKKKHTKHRQAACEKQAHKHYPTTHKKK
jgi:phosphodiesterase/alkaline phosphatase D-like protein